MFLALFGFAGGMGMPMQTSINAQLGRRVGSPFLSALLNFLVGIAALLILTSIVEHGLAIPVGGREIFGVVIMICGAALFYL